MKRPLVDDLLFGKLQEGGKVSVKVKNGQLHFEIKSQKEASRRSLKGRTVTHALTGKSDSSE